MKIKEFKTRFWYENMVESISTDGLVFEVEKVDHIDDRKLVEISPMWFAKRFHRPSTKPESDRKNWSQYRSGKTVPGSRLGFHPVKEVEKAYPPTGRYFFSMIWDILEGKKLGKKAIEKEISQLGIRIGKDRRGFIGKVLLERRFWKRSANIEQVQAGRYSILKDLEAFELVETIILMLAWADEEGDPELWNEICEFYYYVIPEIVWEDDLRLRFELLDIFGEYAQKKKKVPFREAELSKHHWRDETEALTSSLTERYFDQMHTHLFFFQKKDRDSLRYSLAKFVANFVMSDYNLWEKYSEYSWLAVDVLLRFISEKQNEEFNLDLVRHEKELENFLLKEIKRYMDDPKSHELQYVQCLSG